MTCWDIGANIGYYTCLFCFAGRAPGVSPPSSPRVGPGSAARNIQLNSLSNVDVLPHALGQSDGTARIYYRKAEKSRGHRDLAP
jgi:FkbM family methyltransferase